MTFDITVRRHGNGSEYPAHLDIGHVTKRNISWVYDFIEREDEYQDLMGEPRGHSTYEPKISMLMLPDAETLRRRKEDKETMMNQGHMMTSALGSFWWPVSEGHARYDFWENENDPKEEYTFSLEIPM